MNNWKTTIAGIGAALAAVSHLLLAIKSGDTSSLVADVTAIMAGIGLIFAKDG